MATQDDRPQAVERDVHGCRFEIGLLAHRSSRDLFSEHLSGTGEERVEEPVGRGGIVDQHPGEVVQGDAALLQRIQRLSQQV